MADRMVLRWSGMDELRKTLGTIPAAMQPEVQALVLYHARGAEAALRRWYAQGPTGNLRRGVRLGSVVHHGVAAAVLQSRAPHAWIYERGTKIRQGAGGNQIGKGSRKGNKLANRGFSPAHNTFRDVVVPEGLRLYADLKSLLTRRGFLVKDGPPNAA
jgi:hypothetical protein